MSREQKESVAYWVFILLVCTGFAVLALRPMFEEPKEVHACVDKMPPPVPHGYHLVWVDCNIHK